MAIPLWQTTFNLVHCLKNLAMSLDPDGVDCAVHCWQADEIQGVDDMSGNTVVSFVFGSVENGTIIGDWWCCCSLTAYVVLWGVGA